MAYRKIKECAFCGDEFEARHPVTKNCSRECGELYKRERQRKYHQENYDPEKRAKWHREKQLRLIRERREAREQNEN